MSDEYDETGSELRRLLDDRAAGFHPDVIGRASQALHRGRQLRRRRRMAVTSVSVAGVAVVGVVATQVLTPGPSSNHLAMAAAPSATPTVTSTLDGCAALNDVRVRQGASRAAQLRSILPLLSGEKRRIATKRHVAARDLPDVRAELRQLVVPQVSSQLTTIRDLEKLTALCKEGIGSSPAKPQRVPVTLKAAGWTCEPPGDDKFICTSGSDSVLVVVRPARYHHDYLVDPDKAAPGQYVSEVHGGVFATITSQTSGLAEVMAGHLVWK